GGLALLRSVAARALGELAGLLDDLLDQRAHGPLELAHVAVAGLAGPVELRHAGGDLLVDLLGRLAGLADLLGHPLDGLRGHALLHGVLHLVVKTGPTHRTRPPRHLTASPIPVPQVMPQP